MASLLALASLAVDRSDASGIHRSVWAYTPEQYGTYLFAGGSDLLELRAHVGGGFVKTCWEIAAYYPYTYAKVRMRARLPNGTNNFSAEVVIDDHANPVCAVSTAKEYDDEDVIMSIRVLRNIIYVGTASAWELSPGFI